MIHPDSLFVGMKVWHFTYGALSIQGWSESKQTITGLSPEGQIRYFTLANCEFLEARNERERRAFQTQQERESQARRQEQEKVTHLLLKQQRAQERKITKERAKVAECHDDLLRRGFPEFECIAAYESAVFVLTNENRTAYNKLWAHAVKHLRELAAAESDTPVYGRIGFDVWADASTVGEAIEWLTSLGMSDAARYVKIGGGSHGVKVNLCLPNDPELVGLNHKLQTNTLHARCFSGGARDLRTIQIGKRSLLGQLIRDGILPEEIQ